MSTTKRFTWVNRETACRDLLQLAYHAPRFISELALGLLSMIRPPVSFIPELKAIALDTERSPWERRYTLYALSDMPEEIYFPELLRYAAKVKHDPFSPEDLIFEDIAPFCRKHPSNYAWLFQHVEQASPEDYREALDCAAKGYSEQEMDAQVLDRIIALFKRRPDLLTLETCDDLYYCGGKRGRTWINARIQQVVELCLNEEEIDHVRFHTRRWRKLLDAIQQANPALASQINRQEPRRKRRTQSKQPARYETSPIWQRLHSWYLAAKSGDENAFYNLREEAFQWQGNIPIRAVATYFIGLLQDEYPDASATLCSLLRHSSDDSWSIQPQDGYFAPVREEVIKALRRRASPKVWEALVEGYFINPKNSLGWIYPETIRLITDALESGNISHPPLEERPGDVWFYALLDLPDTPT
jgi:hypothetical protein